MKHKQLIFINAIILIIFIFVVRTGIKQESIAHARFIQESMQVENNEGGISNTVLTNYYYAHTHTLEDIQHPPWFHEEHITKVDDEDTELEDDLEEDVEEEEEFELADQEYNHEEVTTETNHPAGTSNDSGGQVNTNRPSQPDSSGQENSSNNDENSTEAEGNNNDGKNDEEDTNNDSVEEDLNSEPQDPEQPETEESENNPSNEYEDD